MPKTLKSATKNPCGKRRSPDNPYEKWVSFDGSWTWLVLKKNQSPEMEAKNPHASWYCMVVTPHTGPRGDIGDTYCSTIKDNATLVYQDPVITPRKPVELREVVNGTDYDSGDALTEAYNILFER